MNGNSFVGNWFGYLFQVIIPVPRKNLSDSHSNIGNCSKFINGTHGPSGKIGAERIVGISLWILTFLPHLFRYPNSFKAFKLRIQFIWWCEMEIYDSEFKFFLISVQNWTTSHSKCTLAHVLMEFVHIHYGHVICRFHLVLLYCYQPENEFWMIFVLSLGTSFQRAFTSIMLYLA